MFPLRPPLSLLLLVPLLSLPTTSPATTACTSRFRTLNGTCTNSFIPTWASAGQPHFSYLPFRTRATPNPPLPSARYVSNILCKQYISRPNTHGLTELFVFFGQFVDHNLVFTPVDRSKPMPIAVPPDDAIFANHTQLAFHRSQSTGPSAGVPHARAINELSSALDLSAVYGVDRERLDALREFKDGKLRVGMDGTLPLNTRGLNNAPSRAARFFLAGDHRANEHAMLTVMHTVFVREHNRLCEELKSVYGDWEDEEVFEMARLMNGVQFQKVVYEEFVPAMLGEGLKGYEGYRAGVNGGVSAVFSTAAFRVGHTMVGNGIHRVSGNGSELSKVGVGQMFFRDAGVLRPGAVEEFLRGALKHRAQEVDVKVVEGLRNMLFSKVDGEEGLDLVALNLQRGRDHGLASYNELREAFGMRRVKRFAEVTGDLNLQSGLAHVYGSVDRIEAWIGMMAEDHKRGAGMGRLLVKVWKREFERMRDGDRFFYKRRGLFPEDMWRRVPRLWEIYVEKNLMRSIILRNCRLREDEVPKGKVFRNNDL